MRTPPARSMLPTLLLALLSGLQPAAASTPLSLVDGPSLCMSLDRDARGRPVATTLGYPRRLASVVDPLPEGDPTQPAATLSVTTGDGVTDYWFDQQWRLEQVVYPEADGERRLHHYTLAGDGTRLMETVWRTWDDAGNPAIEQVERFRHEYDATATRDPESTGNTHRIAAPEGQ